MKAPLSWIKEYADIPVDIKTYIDAMTLSGSKVEGYEQFGQELDKVVVGKVLSVKPHPNADKLVIGQVDVGEKSIQVVTGATNMKENDLVPVVLDGGTIHGGMKIKKGKLRGELSEGMMCSLEELGLDKNDYPHAIEDGIFILDHKTKPGEDIKSLLGLNETVVEFELTSNRPDCYSIIGLARETAATMNTTFHKEEISLKENESKSADSFASVKIEDTDLCSRYMAKIITNVKIQPSPEWLRKRLRNAGVRPINNIVDITNYVMLEYGQPMHAFDLAYIENNEIIVRRAKNGEIMDTLDDQQRSLDEDMLVIADGQKPVAVAGVMGGKSSEVNQNTKTILFESAMFHSVSVRKTAKKLGMRTESSSRFEKGLDIYNVKDALMRACELVERLGAGDVAKGVLDDHEALPLKQTLPFVPQDINCLLGTDISDEKMVHILEKLDFVVKNQTVTVPTYRSDVETYADLAEEIARFYDYNHIKATLLSGKQTTLGEKTPKQKLRDQIHDILIASGLYETVTYSFTSPKVFDKLQLPKDHPFRNTMVISNPLGEDFSIMRTTTLPEMMQVISHNHNRKIPGCGFYEMDHTFHPVEGQKLPEQKSVLTIGAYESDFFTIKGILEKLFNELGMDVKWESEKNQPMYHPGRCAVIKKEDAIIGHLGQIHPQVCRQFDVPDETYIATVDLEMIYEYACTQKSYTPLPRFPAMERDLAIVVDESVPSGVLIDVIEQNGKDLLEEVHLFDAYQGENMEKGKKSLAYALVFRSSEKTLKEEQVNDVVAQILKSIKEQTGGELR